MEHVESIVLHRTKDSPWIYVFTEENCFETRDDSLLDNFLKKGSTWYLTGTLPNGISAVNAITIVVASPARKNYKEFVKYTKAGPLHYLSNWSLNELVAARNLYTFSTETIQE